MRRIGNNISIIINKLTVSYSDHGPDDAPVIIFIHGFPFNKSMWNVQMDALKNNYRVIAYDIRGHGNSDPGNDEFFIELFVNDMLRLMEKLKIEKSLLCGLSLGGYIALNAVLKHPDRFDGLILSDTQCMADTPEIKENRCIAITRIKEKGVELYADESIKKLFSGGSITSNKNVIAEVKTMIINTPKQALYNTLHALAERRETCSRLQEINIPVLIMVGKEDKITPIAAAKQMHEKILNSKLEIIQQAGHLSNLENPTAFNTHLVNFLELVGKKSFLFKRYRWELN
ncbi:MAG: alpha/beta fold hydrolase [Bacteroidetes bacterium]|nr:MAG: alpha/beta fold hydrolase [Bacteroidota bacterium]